MSAILVLVANDCSAVPRRPENNYDEWTLLITTWKCFQSYGIFKSFNLSHWMAPLHFYIYKRMLLFEHLLQPLWSQRKKKGKKQSCYLTACIYPSKSALSVWLWCDYNGDELDCSLRRKLEKHNGSQQSYFAFYCVTEIRTSLSFLL